MKPACSRCTKFGRECGGYKHNLTYEERLLSRSKQSLLPKVEQISQTPLPRNLNLQQHFASTPHRLAVNLGLSASQVFCIEASLELCRVLDLPHWIATNLQICEKFPFLRHAFSAIRMLSKRPSSEDYHNPALALLASIDPHQLAQHQNLASVHHEYFLEGARSALPHGYSDPKQLNLTAIVCLLTICLETLQFQHRPACSHVQVSLTLLHQLLATPHPPPSPPHYPSDLHDLDIHLEPSFINEVINVFKLLEGKAMAIDGGFALCVAMPLGHASPFVNPFDATQVYVAPVMLENFGSFASVASPPYEVSAFGSRATSVCTP